jgi:hypothetical protein
MKQIAILSILLSTLSATTINIPSDYETIQEGIDASVDGDTVLIAQGTYTENLILEKEIVLASHAINDDLESDWLNNENINETIISGTPEPIDPDYGSCLVIRDGNIAPTILGFTFQDGIGTAMVENDTCELVLQRPERSGGAILIFKAYPTIMYNRFINNGSTQADSANGSIAITNGGAIAQFSDEDVEFDEDRNNARRIRHSSRDIPEELNIQNNYFENNSSGDGKNFYSRGYDGSIDVSYSIFDDIDCESNSVNEFVLKSREKEAAYIQNNISGNCIEGNSFYVSMDGNNNNSGTESEPFKTIGHALSLVRDDTTITTTIYVREGVYSPSTTGEQFPIVLPDNVHLIGDNRENSILDAEADSIKQRRVIKIEDCENVKVANLTITGGNIESAGCIGGGGILMTHPDLAYDGPMSSSTPVLENLIITGNHAAAGGGVSIWRQSGPVLSDIIIHENTAKKYGGGLMIFTSVASVTDVIVSGNNCNVDGSFGGGIVMNFSGATMTNVTVTDNTASFGGGVSVGNSDATLTHVTVSGNTATTSGGGFLSTPYSNNTLTNSIIWDNSPESIYAFATTTISYSDIQGGWGGEGNIDADPLFCNPDSSDFTLAENSPCVGTGESGVNMGAFGVGCEAILSTDKDVIPLKYLLHQNYPNPFNPVTTLRYNLPEDGLINIAIYDIMGRVVKTLINGSQTAGYKSTQWNATNNAGEPVSAGVYLYTIQAGEFRQTKKMVLLK